MHQARRRPSHPIVGWAFAVLGAGGLVVSIVAYVDLCSRGGVAPWPVDGSALGRLGGAARVGMVAAILLVIGVLLPLQRLAGDPSRRDFLSRVVTGSLLAVVAGLWMLRLNLVGFSSLWARRELLGDHLLPAALLENRVWSANIMLVFVVALASLPLNTFVRRLLARPHLRRAPWALWALGSVWWVGLMVVVLAATRS